MTTSKRLTRFWFQFEALPTPTALNLGCGITAFGYDDALALLHERVSGPNGTPAVKTCIRDIPINALEKNHVAPNIGDVTVRGIWFPQS